MDAVTQKSRIIVGDEKLRMMAAEERPPEETSVEVKPAEEKSVEAKATEAKITEVKATEAKAVDLKAAEGKPAEGKAPGEKTTEVKAAEPKATEPKAAEPKAAEVKPAESKAADVKAAEAKSVGPKSAEVKAGEAKSAGAKAAEVKSTEKEKKENAKDEQPKEAQDNKQSNPLEKVTPDFEALFRRRKSVRKGKSSNRSKGQVQVRVRHTRSKCRTSPSSKDGRKLPKSPAGKSPTTNDTQFGKDDADDEELMGEPIGDLDTGGDRQMYRRKAEDPRMTFASVTLEQGALYILKKYRRVHRYKLMQATFQAYSANPEKNRYPDVRCMDATRVILTGRPCDYIHANWIKFADGKKFICTQAPMESSVRDFWQMVLQENCHLIIMLCSFIEEDKPKCVPYFPTLAGTSIMVEDVTITLKERNSNGLITVSMFVVKTKDQELHVRHIQYTEWPDHSAPLKTNGALEIHREIFNNPRQYPIIIHCSAGVGRTCTIVGAELMLERISARQFHTATDIVRIMRRARAGAVQKAVQFLFMHYIVLDIFCQEGVVSNENPLMASFRENYELVIAKAEQIRMARKAKDLLKVAQNKRPVKVGEVENCPT
uniref:Protein-tyrosine phosphatase domain containing protein n=2 Tax=Haemonchus contortus TaxID=6289 RepID=A0A7I4YGB1_HAECO